jgi:hypothetical protein
MNDLPLIAMADEDKLVRRTMINNQLPVLLPDLKAI